MIASRIIENARGQALIIVMQFGNLYHRKLPEIEMFPHLNYEKNQ